MTNERVPLHKSTNSWTYDEVQSPATFGLAASVKDVLAVPIGREAGNNVGDYDEECCGSNQGVSRPVEIRETESEKT